MEWEVIMATLATTGVQKKTWYLYLILLKIPLIFYLCFDARQTSGPASISCGHLEF